MNVSIVVFSPSGNTETAGKLLKNILESKNINVDFINIAKNKDYFLAKTDEEKKEFINDRISSHDLLIVGAPVYAHHFQYHMKELIELLPSPDNIKWGKAAIAFVTYGGISSGVSLQDAGKALKKSKRKVIAGAKLSYPHHLTKAFFEDEYNKNYNKKEIYSILESIGTIISSLDLSNLNDISNILNYQDKITQLKAKFIFKEKLWHEKKYPKIIIDNEKCIDCKKCTDICPVSHFSGNSQCIHCFNCFFECPNNAIYPSGDLEKAKDFMEKIIESSKEIPENYLYSD